MTRTHRALFDGAHDFAVFSLPDGSEACLQADVPAARETLVRIKIMEEKFGAHIAFAHDAEWIKKGEDHLLMSLLDDDLRNDAKARISNGQIL